MGDLELTFQFHKHLCSLSAWFCAAPQGDQGEHQSSLSFRGNRRNLCKQMMTALCDCEETEAGQRRSKDFGTRHLDLRFGSIRYCVCDPGTVSSLFRAFVFLSVKWEL